MEDSQDNSHPIPLASEPLTDNNRIMGKSRIQRNLEKQSKRTIAITVLGIVALIILLILYGPTTVVSLSLLAGNVTGKEESVKQNTSDQFIASPILDPLPSATNSATTRVTGQVTLGDQVKLYVNDDLTDVTTPKADNSFTFDDVQLKEGTNTIRAVSFMKDKKSDDSNFLRITYIKEPPELTIDYPSDRASFSGESTLTVKGKTNPDVQVTVNDFIAITRDTGEFSHTMTLQNSENKIKIVAIDKAGNKTEKEIIVKYSP